MRQPPAPQVKMAMAGQSQHGNAQAAQDGSAPPSTQDAGDTEPITDMQ